MRARRKTLIDPTSGRSANAGGLVVPILSGPIMFESGNGIVIASLATGIQAVVMDGIIQAFRNGVTVHIYRMAEFLPGFVSAGGLIVLVYPEGMVFGFGRIHDALAAGRALIIGVMHDVVVGIITVGAFCIVYGILRIGILALVGFPRFVRDVDFDDGLRGMGGMLTIGSSLFHLLLTADGALISGGLTGRAGAVCDDRLAFLLPGMFACLIGMDDFIFATRADPGVGLFRFAVCVCRLAEVAEGIGHYIKLGLDLMAPFAFELVNTGLGASCGNGFRFGLIAFLMGNGIEGTFIDDLTADGASFLPRTEEGAGRFYGYLTAVGDMAECTIFFDVGEEGSAAGVTG